MLLNDLYIGLTTGARYTASCSHMAVCMAAGYKLECLHWLCSSASLFFCFFVLLLLCPLSFVASFCSLLSIVADPLRLLFVSAGSSDAEGLPAFRLVYGPAFWLPRFVLQFIRSLFASLFASLFRLLFGFFVRFVAFPGFCLPLL